MLLIQIVKYLDRVFSADSRKLSIPKKTKGQKSRATNCYQSHGFDGVLKALSGDELHHAAHSAHTVHATSGHRGFFLLFGQIADHAFSRQQQAGD